MFYIMKQTVNNDSQQFYKYQQNGTTTSHHKSLNTRQTMTYDDGIQAPGLRKAQAWGGIKPVNRIKDSPSDNWISNDNIDINKQ